MLGPFATASRLTPIHQVSLAVLSRAAYASMSTTTMTTCDRGDHYGPVEWAQKCYTASCKLYLFKIIFLVKSKTVASPDSCPCLPQK